MLSVTEIVHCASVVSNLLKASNTKALCTNVLKFVKSVIADWNCLISGIIDNSIKEDFVRDFAHWEKSFGKIHKIEVEGKSVNLYPWP